MVVAKKVECQRYWPQSEMTLPNGDNDMTLVSSAILNCLAEQYIAYSNLSDLASHIPLVVP
jgi:hypothetical protein